MVETSTPKESILLHAMQVGIAQRVDKELAGEFFAQQAMVTGYPTSIDPLVDTMIIGIKAYVYSESPRRVLAFYHPKNWWQAFKDEFFPVWLTKYFPVQMRKFETELRFFYPDIKPAISDRQFRRTVQVIISEDGRSKVEEDSA